MSTAENFAQTPDLPDRRYRISEVSEIVDVPVHVLRQWEKGFDILRPKRDRVNRRYYTRNDIELIRRIKDLIRNEKLTIKGAARRLSQEIHGVGRPKTNTEALKLIDQIDEEVQGLLDTLDRYDEDEPS